MILREMLVDDLDQVMNYFPRHGRKRDFLLI